MSSIGCHGMFTIEALVASVCGLSVQIFVGGRFYRNAYTQFRSCSWGMDSLVVGATSTVVTYSFYSLIDCCVYDANHQHLLFDTAAMLLLFVTLGKFLKAGRSSAPATTSRRCWLYGLLRLHYCLLLNCGTSPSSYLD